MKYPKYLDREVYKRVVSVASSYYTDKARLQDLEQLILCPGKQEGPGGGGVGNPTAVQAERLIKYTGKIRERIEAVEKTLELFDRGQQAFIRQNLFSGVKISYCNTEKSERTCQRLRHDFLVALAINLGEIF